MIPATRSISNTEIRREPFDFNPEDEIVSGETVTSFVSLTADHYDGLTLCADSALTLPIPPNTPAISSNIVQIWMSVSGVAVGTVYNLTCTVLTSSGSKIEIVGALRVDG